MSAQHRVPVILTRALAQAERFAETLPTETQAVFSPLLEILLLPVQDRPNASEILLFTSENGVMSIAATGAAHSGQMALCVGKRTAEVAQAAGFDATSADGSAADLIQLALTTSGPFTHVRGVHTRGDIAETLRAAGHTCRELVLYDQIERPLSAEASDILSTDQPCLVPLFSRRTAELFLREQPKAVSAHIICLSTAVADALSTGSYASVSTSRAPRADALLSELSDRLRAIRLEAKGVSG